MFQGKCSKALLIGAGLVLFQQITGPPSVLYYAASILQSAGFFAASDATRVSILLGVLKLIMTGVAVMVVDKVGRRPLLLGGVSFMVVSLFLLGSYYTFLDDAPAVAVIASPSNARVYVNCRLVTALYVIVRDLFYNQPVRRKHIQSSPKKVLHSVKKCVLRIAIVHPKVFFEVVDIESEDELFCTTPSSSPLSLLTSGFGIEISSSLHELNVSDGVLKLSGYMSSPRDTSFVKACQFVCIHEIDYLAITHLWTENFSHGNSSGRGTVMSEEDNTWREGDDVSSPEKDLPEKYEIAKRRCRMYNHRASFGLPSPQLEMPTEESDHMFHWKDNRFSCQDASEHQIRLGSLYQTDYSFQSCDGLLAPSRVTVNQKSATYLQATDHNIFSSEDHFLGNKFFGEKRSSEHTDYILGSRLEDAHFNVDASISNGFNGSALSPDCFEIGDDVDKISEDLKPFLHNCSCRRSLPVDGASPASSEGFDFRINGFGAKRKSLEPNDWVCVGEIDDNNQRFDFLPGTLWQDEAARAWSSPGPMSKCDVLTGLDFLSRDSIESSAIGGECLAGENDLPPDSIARVGEFFSSRQSLKSEWSSVMSDPLFRTKSQNVDNFFDENALERRIKYDNSSRYDYLAERVVKDRGFYFDDSLRKNSSQEDFSTSFANMCSGFESCVRSKEDNCRFIQQHNLDDVLFSKCPDIFIDETEWLCLDSHGKYNANCSAVTSHHISSAIYDVVDEGLKDPIIYQQEGYVCKRRPKRSHSAPPFYRGKKKFFTLNTHLAMEAKKLKAQAINNAPTSQETSGLKHPQQSSGECQLYSEPNSVEDPSTPDKKKAHDMKDIKKCDAQKSEDLNIYSKDLVEDCTLKETHDPLDSGLKWQKSCLRTARGDKLHNPHNESNILDVSSRILHLAGDSLVPVSINKNCLEDAKVLQQVDKKFIPIVGGGVLAIIDQHAADERIRLEELRQKVLSGEMKTVTYLDTEQKLVLPEIGYQLLHNYADQIQNWGWLCNIRSLGSRNLNLLHRQPTVVTLNAVPCIVGVNLTDVDLLEFLQQLADTDGSSTIPPSVHRVLNSKACRGAIMFGDTLLPSECSLIVEELKQTSLCFQCAHGRPTTVPLVNLEALHKQIAKLGLWNGGSNELWHGLHQHEPSLERAAQRLSSARGLS
ncbi:DNA mismatch repair protein MLH3 [Camellia lanceoleosa]|uniref:DNA mismatch repair protein MLH3 n=1 Tax=Camellia lanceoleosa TaxID=1840588 RepID=A0ACC0HY83_9ERIC|nr:DNA mismatch repair protein MLH3 [Camellia lanceoleosa]